MRDLKGRNFELLTEDDFKNYNFVMFVPGPDGARPIMVNIADIEALIDGLGPQPADWAGGTVGLFIQSIAEKVHWGKVVVHLNVRVTAATPATPGPSSPDEPGT